MRSRRLVPALTTMAALTAALTGFGPAATAGSAARPCTRWASVQPPSPGSASDDLFGVAVLAAGNAWAVGDESGGGPFQTLIEHWNGSKWTRVPSPSPGRGDNYLSAVHAVSATSVWAVGGYAAAGGGILPDRTLILHWNGRRWTQLASPHPGSYSDQLNGVRTVSASSAWAVGESAGASRHDQTLILHWNGRRWTQVRSPDPGTTSNVLTAVDGAAADRVWAVGSYARGGEDQSLVLRWNGKSWQRVTAPSPAGSSELNGVAATSAASAWAVGDDARGRSLVLHWNGRTWSRTASPNVLGQGDDNLLEGVAATSAANAWAVGSATILGTGPAFELHWNGRKWSNMASPNPGDTSALYAVAASSAAHAWAVGTFSRGPSGSPPRTLAFRCH